jgi:rieske iron-sulfur protein
MDAERRTLLKAGLVLGLAFGHDDSSSFGQDDPSSIRPRPGDLMIRSGDASRTPLSPADIPLASIQTMAWAMDPADRIVRSGSRLNQVILLRLDPDSLSAETRAHAADGVVAYTSICTHTGCDVDDWQASDRMLACQCHFSVFDPRDGAKVVDGPAPRPLPALPLKLVDGKLVVAQSFTAPVGFEKG